MQETSGSRKAWTGGKVIKSRCRKEMNVKFNHCYKHLDKSILPTVKLYHDIKKGL